MRRRCWPWPWPCPCRSGRQDEAASSDRLVLVTLDGARREEIFGGLDLPILTSTLKNGQRAEETDSYRRFWAATADERRRKLMPFFWRLVSEQGSIAGNWTLWIVFNEIAEHVEGATLVNAGPENLEPAQDPDTALVNRLRVSPRHA